MSKITVVAALVDVHFLHLYTLDGSEVNIAQGDPRLQPLLQQCMAGLKKEGDQVVVDTSETNYFADYEKKSGGLVSLFRVAKSKVAEFFGKTEEKVVVPAAPIVLGKVPGRGTPTVTAVVTRKAPTEEAKATKLASAVEEILAHAVPVSHNNFKEPEKMPEAKKYQTVPDTAEGDTLIAVVGGQVIAGVEQLKPQFVAASTGNGKGMDAFLQRISKVISKRRHSVEDLLKFLEKGDLPLADDGSIIAYKRLNRKSGKVLVDVHSGNVTQQVGSYVHMDEGMVDEDRRNDCSHGLHIARRGYLSGFSGNVTVICKINPEDVIAVPQYDANKVRVCAYHIIAELTDEQARKVNSNVAMTDDDSTQLLLGKILSGDHIGITEYVKIGGPKGSDLTIWDAEHTPVVKPKADPLVTKPRKATAVADGEKVSVAPVDVKAVAAEVYTNKQKGKGVYKPSSKELAKDMYSHVLAAVSLDTKKAAAAGLVMHKKQTKKSWVALGLTEGIGKAVQDIAKDLLPQKGAIFTSPETVAKAEAKVVKQTKKADKAVVKATNTVDLTTDKYEVKATKKRVVPTRNAEPAPKVSPTVDAEAKVGGPRQQIATLLTRVPSKVLANEIVAIKKKAKKSWDALGVTPEEVAVILELADK